MIKRLLLINLMFLGFVTSYAQNRMSLLYKYDVSGANICNGSAGISSNDSIISIDLYHFGDNFNGVVYTGTKTQFDSLCKGIYTVNCTFSDFKTDTLNFSIEELKQQDCNGFNAFMNILKRPSSVANCDGSVKVEVNGGVAPYTYNWSDSSIVSNSITNACSGNYSVEVLDSKNCKTYANIFLNTDTMKNGDCNGFNAFMNVLKRPSSAVICDGSVKVEVNGGVAPYTYKWSDSSIVSNSITNACSGNYSVEVLDSKNCKTYANIFLNTDTMKNGDCNGFNAFMNVLKRPSSVANCDGSIKVEVNGGVAPYTYNWSDSSIVSNFITNACTRNYSVEVIDSKYCKTYANIFLNTDTNTNVNCSNFYLSFIKTKEISQGMCNGEAVIEFHNGKAPFQIMWSDSSVGNSSMLKNACAKEYTVNVSDANNCFASTVIKFNAVKNCDSISAQTIIVNESVQGFCNGTAQIYPIGGNIPYVYYWNNQKNTSGYLKGLCSGETRVHIIDSEGCKGETIIKVKSDSVFIGCDNSNLGVNFQTKLVDAGKCNGEIISTPYGGSAPYKFNWNNGYLSKDLKNVCRGNYQLTITDANKCSHTQNIEIKGDTTQTTPLKVDFRVFDETSIGACDGRINISVAGGNAPYNIDHGDQSGANISGLCAGKHIFTVMDSKGQIFNGSYLIASPDRIIKNEKNNLKDSISVAILENIVINNCLIDFSKIDSVKAFDYLINQEGLAEVIWRIFNGVNFTEITEKYAFNQKGIYTVRLNIFCTLANGQTESEEFIKAEDKIEIEQVLSSNNINLNFIKVYPNPTQNNIIVEVNGNYNAQLLDLTGRVLQTITLNAGQNIINLVNYPSGIYFIQSTNFRTIKVIKN